MCVGQGVGLVSRWRFGWAGVWGGGWGALLFIKLQGRLSDQV